MLRKQLIRFIFLRFYWVLTSQYNQSNDFVSLLPLVAHVIYGRENVYTLAEKSLILLWYIMSRISNSTKTCSLQECWINLHRNNYTYEFINPRITRNQPALCIISIKLKSGVSHTDVLQKCGDILSLFKLKKSSYPSRCGSPDQQHISVRVARNNIPKVSFGQ